MTDVLKVSNSELQTFKDCRRRWWLAYFRRLQPREKVMTGPLALGTRIHAAFEQYYASGVPLLDAHAELVERDKELLVESFRDTTDLQWVEENGIDAELEFISSEEVVSAPLLEGQVELQGKLDMRVRRKVDGVRMFRDFKTVGGSFADFTSMAHMNEQVLTYMLLEAQKKDEIERCDGGIFTMLRKVKRTANARPPFYEQIEVRHNIFSLRSFWNRIHGTITDLLRVRKGLEDGGDHTMLAYPRPSRDCKWKCQFFAVCPLLDDGSAAEQAISEMYVVDDPYSYYKPDNKGNE
jgi:hypothetical protein